MSSAMHQHAGSTESQEFVYKGKRVSISQGDDQGTIRIDDRKYQATREATTPPMWVVAGVFGHYTSLSKLARFMIDYLYLMPTKK